MGRLYDSLVNKMVWLNDAAKHPEELPEELEFKPFITVSRDPGSGGKPIAKALAERLNYKFYDEELINAIAKSAKARKEVLEKVDEKQRTIMEDLVHSILNPEYISEHRYIKHLVKVVLHLAKEGNAVFLGRGTNFITPNASGLHVRITAPYRVCVSRAVHYEKIPHQKAREIIREIAAEREGFVKQYFGKDANNPKYYDLTINTTYMTIEQAVDIIEVAFKHKLG
jgi:cytidylate kinase